VNLRAGNRSKKTRKKHVRLRSTLVTCEKPLAAFYCQLGMSVFILCIFTYFDDLGIILLFAFALRFFELQTAPWKPQGNQRVIESSSWVSWVLGKWNLVSSARHAKWMSFSRFWTKLFLGTHPHNYWNIRNARYCKKNERFCTSHLQENKANILNKTVHFVSRTHVASTFDTLQLQPEMDASSKPCGWVSKLTNETTASSKCIQ
jgi:hypothetical protein